MKTISLRAGLKARFPTTDERRAKVWCPRFSVLSRQGSLKAGHQTGVFQQALSRILSGAVLFAAAVSLAAAEADGGFQKLFNGGDLAGWNGNPVHWSVKDGAITGQTTPEHPAKGNTFLIWTNGTVGDFELRLSYRITANNDQGFANSGIQYRSKVVDEKTWAVGGYQADLEAGTTYSGILYDERGVAGGRNIMAARGEIVIWDKDCKKQVTGSLGKSEAIQAAIKKDGWNDYVVIAQGNHLQHFINGKPTADVTDDCEARRLDKGVLALQLHAGQPMTVAFKDIRLKPLSPAADAAAGDVKKLQGVWVVAGGEVNGSSLPAEMVPDLTLTISGKTYKVSGADRADSGEFAVDPAKQPKQMDIRTDSGDSLTAIYEIGEDSFRVCYAQGGEGRPKSFTTEPDSGRFVLSYKRKKN